jgi:hypothetical protein
MRSGCHEQQAIMGPLEFKRGIGFDHSHHYGTKQRGINLRCTSCHSQIVQGNHMAVTEFTCFLCHFRGRTSLDNVLPVEFCTNCHTYPQNYIDVGGIKYNHADYVENGVICWRCHSDVIQGDGHVEDRACLQCHSDPEQLNKIGEVEQVHQNHVTDHKVECFNCHANIRHGVPEETTAPVFDCSACHHDTHLGPREMYAGTGGVKVEDMPSAMFRVQVDCTGCHFGEMIYGTRALVEGGVRLSSVEACVDCHGEMGREIYEYWTNSVDAQLEKTRPILENARTRVRNAEDAPLEAQQLLNDAQHNFDFVEASHGVHNLNYALELLKQARTDAEAAVAALEE